jgi:hypothetical protein
VRAKAHDHFAGAVAGVQAHAGVALFLSVLKVAVQASQDLELAHHIGGLGFDFLHANTIGFGFFKPGFKPLVVAERMPLRLRLVSLNKVFSHDNKCADQHALAQSFVQFSLDCGVLKFGEFKTKAGRMSPYFFNAGLFDDGAKLGPLAACYAQRLVTAAWSST